MMSVDRVISTWSRGVDLSSEAIMSFGRLATSFANDLARRFIRAALFRAFTFVLLIFSSYFILWL